VRQCVKAAGGREGRAAEKWSWWKVRVREEQAEAGNVQNGAKGNRAQVPVPAGDVNKPEAQLICLASDSRACQSRSRTSRAADSWFLNSGNVCSGLVGRRFGREATLLSLRSSQKSQPLLTESQNHRI